MKNSLAKNAVYKVILNIFNLFVPLFVGPYIAGLLNKDLYGIYNRVFAEFQVFFIIGAFGIYNYGIREISKVRNNEKRFQSIFTSLFLIGILSNVIVTAFYIVYFMQRSTGVDKYVYLVMIIQMMSNIFYIEFVNEAVENYAFITKKTIIIRFLYFVAIFVFVRKPSDVIIYSVVVSATVFFNNFVSFLYLKRKYKFCFANIEIKKHIVPLFVSLILTNVELLYSQLDKVMLSPFVNDIAVTEYTLPTTLIGMLSTIPLSLITVSIPRLSRYVGENNKEEYMNTLHNTSRVYMAILAPMAFGVLVLSKEIMWLYSKDVYTYTFPILALAAMSRIIYGYQSIMTHLVLYVNGKEKQLTGFLFMGGLLNVVLNFLLVMLHKFSAGTALFTTMISSAFFAVIAVIYSQKRLNIKCNFFEKKVLRYFAVSALFIPVSMGIRLLSDNNWINIIFTVVSCVGVYAVFMFVTKDPLVELVLNRIRRKKNI